MRPAELVRHAAESGLSAIALTDHDTVGGIDEALEAGRRLGLEVNRVLK
jgi:predicted metal-dependent phosphoesterase TrpH